MALNSFVQPVDTSSMADEPTNHWIVRVTSWVNAIALTLMVGIGLLSTTPSRGFAPKGYSVCCYPFEWGKGDSRGCSRLAGARRCAALHLRHDLGGSSERAIYLTWIYLTSSCATSGRERATSDSLAMVEVLPIFITKDHPRQGKHTALQRARTSRCHGFALLTCDDWNRHLETGAVSRR